LGTIAGRLRFSEEDTARERERDGEKYERERDRRERGNDKREMKRDNLTRESAGDRSRVYT
jgi:hypothetical protein